MSRLIGQSLGPYQIVEQIGRGGMATVYRAHQPALGRDVAVKVLRDTFDTSAAARFKREARAVASLHHPNILPIYDFGDDQGHLYFVSQFIPGGRTLVDEIAAGPMDPARALALLALLLDALAYAHARGIIHRDVKPANVMLPQPDWPLLGDFGIAVSLTATTDLTLPGQIIGTADYMAPERAADRPADARADLYAVGVMLFELLTGSLPFAGETPLAVLVAHVNEPVPSPRALAPQLPVALERAVLKALAKDPANRFQSAREMAEELRRIARGLEQPAAPSTIVLPGDTPATASRPAPVAAPGAQVAPPPPAARRGMPWLPLLLLGALVALGLWLALGRGSPAELRLEDTAWEGGYRRSDGVYAGRTATWVYAAGSGFETMRARFELAAPQPAGATLTVEGMDAEGAAKSEIVIAVNGQTIFKGPNPLPNSPVPVGAGSWASHSWAIDGALLRGGANEITITNLSSGQPFQPPFFMLDYAVVAPVR